LKTLTSPHLFINQVTFSHRADILLNTALKKFRLNANKTLDAKLLSCSSDGLSFVTSANTQ